MRVPVWLPAALLGIVVHLGTLANGLVYDDPLAFEHARKPLLELLPHRYGVTAASLHLDHVVWSGWLPGFRMTNLLLHGAASGLVAVSALAVGASRAAALACGAVFAVHPVHVESVASLENRKEILAMIFVAAALILHRRGGGLATTLATVAAFVLALGAKDVAAVGLALMLPLGERILGVLPDERPRARRRVLAVALAGVVTAGWLARDALANPSAVRASTRVFESRAQALATSAAAVPELARLLVVPARLSADHPKNLRASLGDPRALLGAAMAVAWVGGGAALARSTPLAGFAILWTAVMYLPLSNVVATLTPYPVAERYLYVPSFGLCLLAGIGVAWLVRPAHRRPLRAAGVAVAIAVVLAGAARSAARVADWREGLGLWSAALAAYPEGSTRIHAELGMAMLAAGRATEAIPHLERALAIGPPEATFHNNLGLALWQAGRRAEAIAPFERALAMWPSHQMMRFNLGSALLQLGRVDAARAQLAPLADPAAWRSLDRSVLVALHAQNASPESLRVSIRQWLDAGPRRR
jgi:tetratricopeptide (TPR) repeat protein